MLVSVVSIVTVVTVPSAAAGDESRSNWTEAQRRAHGRSLWPNRNDDPPLASRVLSANPGPSRRPMLAAPATTVSWPVPAAVVIEVSAAPTPRRGPAGAASVGGLPVRVSRADTVGPDRVRVEVLDRSAALAAGVDGVLLRVSPVTGERVAASAVELRLDYGGFAGAYGGDWASRLGLVRLPACVLTDSSDARCQTRTPLGSVNDPDTQTLTAPVDLASAIVLAVTSGPSGPTGDWAATPLSASATWQVSTDTGNFSWSYPLRVPPAPGGPAPELKLSYSSQSMDGRVASTNNQTSWVGDGWELWPGYVERKYAGCADDDTSGANNVGHETGDLCWKSDNATLVLNGSASELVRDEPGGAWKQKDDDGSKVQRLTGGTNADNDTEYWKVTTTDGTQYFFGVGKRYPTDPDRTNSTWTVPVFGNHSGEPCHAGSFASSSCRQGWRWNLDYVVDPRGNTLTYFYTAETNNYGKDLNSSVASYDRGGWLDHIDYGERQGSEHTTTAPAQVWFTLADRCLSNCSTVNETTWPDVPADLICSSTTSCPDVMSPAYFTRKRLTAVTTKVSNGTGYDNAESWTLAQSFPDPGDATNPVLWLDSITHKGLSGGTVTLPKVVLHGVQMDNRVDKVGDLGPPMRRYRVNAIDTEAGATISINYTGEDCSTSNLPASPDSNTRRCFPVYWTPEGATDPVREYFHKYLVDSVVADARTGANPGTETHYSYVGGAAWHYDDNELVPAKYRTWGEFRGYATVDVTTGAPTEPVRSRVRYRYFRGMNDDRLADGTHRTVTVDGIADNDRLAGFMRERIIYNGVGGAEVSGTVNAPWLSGATATGADGTKAYLLGTATIDGRVTAPAVPGGVRRTRTVTTFDPTFGLTTTVDDQGDTAIATDDLCTRYEYAQNSSLTIVNTVSRAETVSVNCVGTVSRPADVVSDVRTYYDNLGWDVAPTKGLVTKTEQVRSYSGATPVYLTAATTSYDAQGRPTAVTDALDRTTTTAYTPSTGGPLTRTVVTTPDPDGAGSLTAHATTTDLSAVFGVPTRVTDPNGKITQATYDGLGRLSKVWLPGRTTAQTPNLEYAYRMPAKADGSYDVGAGPVALTIKKLLQNEGQLATVQLYDGLLRLRQTQAPGANRNSTERVVTETFYDSRGLVELTNNPWVTTGAPSTTLIGSLTAVPGRTRYEYDGAGRTTAEIFDVGEQERWRTTTNYGGDRVTVDPPTGATPTTTITDARGRTTALWQYLGASPTGSHQDTSYGYDHADRLASMTDAAGNQWGYGYDLLGRQTSATDPDKGATSSTYDDAGQLTSTTDARGKKLWFVYDALGRKTELRDDSATGALRATWTYDTLAKGELTSSTRYAGAAQYTTAVTGYDNGYRPLGLSVTLPSAGVPTGESVIAGTYTTTYTYAIDGQPKTLKHPAVANLAAETVTTNYDALSIPQWLFGGAGWGAYVSDSLYSPYGEPLLLDLNNTYADLLNYSYELGTRRLHEAWLLREGGSGYDYDATYGYDDAGNVTSLVNQPSGAPVDASCYRYDPLRRLTEAWTPVSANCAAAPSAAGLGGPAPYWTSYTYSPDGNRATETRHATAGDTVRAYTYPPAGGVRPHAVTQVAETGPGGATTYRYGYDAVGNTTCRPAGAATNTCPSTASQALTWDPEGRPATLTANGQASSYLYTAGGDRLIRREGGVTTVYLPGGQELRLTVGSGAKTATRYYAFAGRTVAARTGTGLAGVSTLIADHHGTADLSIANTTHVLTQRRHDPFGNPRGAAPTWPGDHDYLDQPKDTSGLTHLGAREYDSSIGRFVSIDPLLDLTDPQQWNGYAYANNNPTTNSDPSGLILPAPDSGPPPAQPPSSSSSSSHGSGCTNTYQCEEGRQIRQQQRSNWRCVNRFQCEEKRQVEQEREWKRRLMFGEPKRPERPKKNCSFFSTCLFTDPGAWVDQNRTVWDVATVGVGLLAFTGCSAFCLGLAATMSGVSAQRDFRNGDYVNGSLNAVSAVTGGTASLLKPAVNSFGRVAVGMREHGDIARGLAGQAARFEKHELLPPAGSYDLWRDAARHSEPYAETFGAVWDDASRLTSVLNDTAYIVGTVEMGSSNVWPFSG